MSDNHRAKRRRNLARMSATKIASDMLHDTTVGMQVLAALMCIKDEAPEGPIDHNELEQNIQLLKDTLERNPEQYHQMVQKHVIVAATIIQGFFDYATNSLEPLESGNV